MTAEIDPLSEYVFALCRLDTASYLEDDDPLGSIAAAIGELPAATDQERAEVAFLASSLTIYFNTQYGLDAKTAGYFTAACVFAGSMVLSVR